jgi:hypothetical protein
MDQFGDEEVARQLAQLDELAASCKAWSQPIVTAPIGPSPLAAPSAELMAPSELNAACASLSELCANVSQIPTPPAETGAAPSETVQLPPWRRQHQPIVVMPPPNREEEAQPEGSDPSPSKKARVIEGNAAEVHDQWPQGQEHFGKDPRTREFWEPSTAKGKDKDKGKEKG